MFTRNTKRPADIYFILVLAAAACWIFSFRDFLSVRKALIDDATAYYAHINFYLSSMLQGVYPLWDPYRDYGSVNEFYLRRIGEFNPFLWLNVIFTKLGFSFAQSYRLFLGSYFFLGMAGFYLLARRLFKDPRAVLTAVLLVLFSSISTLTFQSYLVLVMVPEIWFFYFCTAFVQTPRKLFLLGAVFALMVVSTTYIPFYVLTIVLAGVLALMPAYAGSGILAAAWQRCRTFCAGNKKFSAICALLLGLSLLPGLSWYMQSQKGQVVFEARQAGTEVAKTSAVHIDLVNEGGIVAPLVLDHMFFDLQDRRMGDFYVPLFAFLVLVLGAFTAFDRRQVFLCIWAFLLYLVGVADAAHAHKFLYNHVFFFKLFRNTQFFIWLGIFPLLALLAAQVFERLLAAMEQGKRALLLAYTVLVHVAAAVFFAMQEDGTIAATYVTIAASFAFFTMVLYKRPASWTALMLFVALLAQPVQVANSAARFYPLDSQNTADGLGPFLFDPKKTISAPYLATPGFHALYSHIDSKVLNGYLQPRFLAYDRLEIMDDAHLDFPRIRDAFFYFENTAFVPPGTTPLTNGAVALPKAQVVAPNSPQLTVVHFDANTLSLKTNFGQTKFLVYNANYDPAWKAFCDGKQVPLLRANISFQGWWVPAGEHAITLRFENPWLSFMGYGLAVVFMAVLATLIWLLCKHKA